MEGHFQVSRNSGPSGSSRCRLAETDEVAGHPVEHEQDSKEAGDIPKPISLEPGENIDSIYDHPGPIVKTEDILKEDMSWKDIGSGTFAKTFRGATHLKSTTRNGPPLSDVHRRTVWSLSTGRVIDDCLVDDVADEVLHRKMPVADDLRVELVMKDALDVPVIGIGAGPHVDGQILVLYDILGITQGRTPRFVRNFQQGHDSPLAALQAYVKAVKDRSYPAPEHCFS